ncbi:MAG: ABC transporter substrate-binding protein [Actinomycetales bacterium]|nr:ABC transporter substrate-binding protein [Actinomycetales bacterium]
MKLLKSLRLAAGVLATALLATACGGGSSDGETSATTGSAAAGEAVSIGITQIVSHPSLDAARDGFKQALADAGYDATYDEQNAQGDPSTAASIAGTFASADLDLILAIATPTAQSVVQAVTDTPILFTAVTDPVSADLVESLEAPGGNATGTSDANPVMEQLELVTRLAPDATRVGIVYSSGEVNSQVQVEWAKEAAADLGLEIVEAAVSTSAEVQQAAESLDVDAFYVVTDNAVVSALESLIQVAETKKIPAIAAEGDSVARGTIATYGISYYELGYQTGEMAVKILKGEAEPATMPVETQSELQLYLNLGAAERMGVTIPEDLLAEADPANITE